MVSISPHGLRLSKGLISLIDDPAHRNLDGGIWERPDSQLPENAVNWRRPRGRPRRAVLVSKIIRDIRVPICLNFIGLGKYAKNRFYYRVLIP